MPKKKLIKKESRKEHKEREKVSLEGPYQSPRGMRDIMGDELYAYQGFFEKASEVAIYYGFTPIETPVLEQEEVFIRGVGQGTDVVDKELYTLRTKSGDRLALRPEYTAGIMRAYLEHGMQSLPQPVMLYSYGKLYRHDKPQRGRYREFHTFDIEILGSEKSINDAVVIKVFMAIMEEVGLQNLELRINSIGDKDCRPNYRKELINYYKKHLGKVCHDCLERFKTNPLRLLDCKEPVCQEIKKEAPNSISYLCESCKLHFKELLECLEALKIPYVMDHTLVRGLDYYTRTVFEVSQNQEAHGSEALGKDGVLASVPGQSLAVGGGGRYDYLAKILGSNKPVPAVGFGMGVDRIVQLLGKETLAPRFVKKPKVFFIQLGPEAKLLSLTVIEILRQAKISVVHSVSKDSLASQLAMAEKTGVPYTILLGQREVIDKTVIVRDMGNRSQKSISLPALAQYVRDLTKPNVAKK